MKKYAAVLLAVLMLMSILPISALADGYYAGLFGGGTESSPYVINNSSDWETFIAAVESDPDYGEGIYFKLGGKIGAEGDEVDTSLTEFRGVFDGENNEIWHSGVKAPFGNNYGEIKNIVTCGPEDRCIFYGGTVCEDNRGVVDHCENRASFEGGIDNGGICGKNFGLIVNCINYGHFEPNSGELSGGICKLNSGLILNCINTADVTGCGISGSNGVDEDERIEICFNCGIPSTGYAITRFPGDTECRVIHLQGCGFLSPIGDVSLEASDSAVNNTAVNNTWGGENTSVEGGIGKMNSAIDEYKNMTGRTLYKWTVGEDGLPAYKEPSPIASMVANGSILIICIAAAAVLGAVATLLVINIKRKAK